MGDLIMNKHALHVILRWDNKAIKFLIISYLKSWQLRQLVNLLCNWDWYHLHSLFAHFYFLFIYYLFFWIFFELFRAGMTISGWHRDLKPLLSCLLDILWYFTFSDLLKKNITNERSHLSNFWPFSYIQDELLPNFFLINISADCWAHDFKIRPSHMWLRIEAKDSAESHNYGAWGWLGLTRPSQLDSRGTESSLESEFLNPSWAMVRIIHWVKYHMMNPSSHAFPKYFIVHCFFLFSKEKKKHPVVIFS